MNLLVPESVEAERINAEIERQVDAQIDLAQHWNRELKRIDPGLSLVLGKENADDMELRAGYWAIRKVVPGSVDAYIVLQGPQGQYREPGPWMLEMLNENDMWNDRRRHERKEIKRRLSEAKARAEQTEKEQRLDEAELAMRAAKRLRGPEGFTKTSTSKRRGEGLKSTSNS